MGIYVDTLANISERTVKNVGALKNVAGTANVTANLGALITLVVLLESDDPEAERLRGREAARYDGLNADLVRDGLLWLDPKNATKLDNGNPDRRSALKRLRNSLAHFRVDPEQDGNAESTKAFAFEDGPDPRRTGNVWRPNWWARIQAHAMAEILGRVEAFLQHAKGAVTGREGGSTTGER